MKKNKIPKKVFELNDSTIIKCVINKKISKKDLINGRWKFVGTYYKNDKLIYPTESMVPDSKGKYSAINKDGEIVVRKDLPMEKVYYTQDRTINDWHGHEHDVTMDVPYNRYQRQKTKAPSIKISILAIRENIDDVDVSFSFDIEIVKVAKNWEKKLLFLINLSLELFDEFDLVEKQTNVSILKTIKTNWLILPPGEYPFNKIRESINERIKLGLVSAKSIDMTRLDFIESLNPVFNAIGTSEFRGYIVFGFRNKNTYILDNSRIGNAIYIFKGNWQDFSKQTKKELITKGTIRIVHNGDWKNKLLNQL